jgi:cholesterol oxidase
MRARTNSEQLISITRPYSESKRDPDRFHITPGSVAITSGVWPDDQTSIEPVYYGVGSDLMAFAMTYHQKGPQKHPVEGWLKSLIEHPSEVLDKLDARHWSERQLVLLCMQTSDTSVDLFWKDGMLRSRHGSGPAPAAHIPVVEAFADRLARKMHGEQAAMWSEVLNRTASAHFIGGITIGERADQGLSIPTSGHSVTLACT